MTGIIDVHHHVVPDFYVKALADRSITRVHGLKFPAWSPKKSLAMMKSLRIEKAFLSYSTPGIDVGSGSAALVRRCNDYLADLCNDNPDRFGAFGSLPLTEPEAAEEELSRVLDKLGLDGIALLSNTNGVYLDHPKFNGLLGKLNERNATVFIHPTDPVDDGYDGLVNVFYGWFIETSRAVAMMEKVGIFDRYPRITFILAHGGGASPAIRDVILKDGRANCSLYCDTAKVAEAGPLATIGELFGPERVFFGSDFPWADSKKAKYWIGKINERWKTEPQRMSKLFRGNADLVLSKITEEVAI